MANTNCFFCGFDVRSDDHVFNIRCALSNAESDQVEAEAHEAMRNGVADVGSDRAFEVARDVIRYARFVRNLYP